MGERAPPAPRRRLPGALALLLAGLPGLVSLLWMLPPVEGVPVLLLLANPALLLLVMVAIGTVAAPACGLRSRIADHAAGRPVALLPPLLLRHLALGAAAGIAIALLDHATRGLWQVDAATPPSLVQSWSLPGLAIGVLYGGIVEEITMRYGVMSLIVVTVWQLAGRSRRTPPPSALWAGIVLAALVFAGGHLPPLAAAGVPLEAPLVARTLLWNGLLGVLFGQVFARHDLETAMATHAGFHLGLWPAGMLAIL